MLPALHYSPWEVKRMRPPEVKSEMMQYPGHGGTPVNAYSSRPTSGSNHPGVIVIMEAFGLNDHIKDVADRFAREGYIALAPDMYTREGTPDLSDPAKIMDNVVKVMFSVPDSQAMGDLDAGAQFIKGQPDSNGKVGAIGFCSGGRYTLMFGCTSKNLDAAVDSAGGFIIQDDFPPTRPVSPIDMVKDLNCPLFGLFGEEDPNPSPEHAEKLKAELDKHNKAYEMRIYPKAGHAFFADYRDSYRPVAAQDMWHRVLTFYDKHLSA
jgi:carboxymethylenebutenolidase